MDSSLLFLFVVIAAVLLIGGVFSYNLARKQEKKELDRNTGSVRTRSPVAANPIFWAYVLFAAFAAAVAAYFLGVFDNGI